ncbi:MAG: glycosyltransferase family 4 protein [Methylobacter sp.]|uniref:glycosyltransferase family 4 protein n=1 Tax=Methylobacter sp. TaxID=2051955 RepID=UPI00272FFE9E|nr:glycosyltransferase family 4 protein [Methylobacter sp.]MDP1663601.1 glycosyltransferase family 4 protein [Methylobacter sp.]
MKILHITPACYPATYWGGPIFTVYALNNALAEMSGVTLRVLTTDTAGPKLSQRLDHSQLIDLYPNQEVIMVPRIAGISVSIEMLWQLPSLVRWADVIHLTAIYSFPTIPTLLICRVLRKPVVWSPHGAVQDAYEWTGSKRKGLKRAWEILCNILIAPGRVVTHVISERERIPTQARIPKANAVIVPNGINLPNVIAEKSWMPEGKLRLLYLGRLSPKKGIENLLHAMALLNDQTVVLSVYGVGDAVYDESLLDLADKLGLLNKNVFFIGHVDGDKKDQAFYHSDVCIVPSYTECFCMVVAEALIHGVPVIASQGTPWAEIEGKRCGLWVNNSPDSLAFAIARVRTMDLLKMGERGRDWMMHEFSWNIHAKKMMEIYKSLVLY